jgi:methionyl-tRNA formyltransferase
MGTPDFAVPALEALHRQCFEILLIVTQPDRRKGRGRRLTPPPVKKFADRMGYPVLQPASIRDDEVLRQFRDMQPDFFVVVAFGHILPENVLEIPAKGAVNVHASLLPKYRGPAPIQWAIINGETQTGVTIMMMDKGLDTGDILLSATEPILPLDTAGTLHDRLSEAGARLLPEALEGFWEQRIRPIPQGGSGATYAPLLTKYDGHISWSKPAGEIEPFIRGVTPWPGAFTFHGSRRIKIFRSKIVDKAVAASPGTILPGFPDELVVAAGRGALSIQEIQGASGKRLAIGDFLRGYRIGPGDVLS